MHADSTLQRAKPPDRPPMASEVPRDVGTYAIGSGSRRWSFHPLTGPRNVASFARESLPPSSSRAFSLHRERSAHSRLWKVVRRLPQGDQRAFSDGPPPWAQLVRTGGARARSTRQLHPARTVSVLEHAPCAPVTLVRCTHGAAPRQVISRALAREHGEGQRRLRKVKNEIFILAGSPCSPYKSRGTCSRRCTRYAHARPCPPA